MIQTIDITMNEEMASEIQKRAASMHIPMNKYIKLVLLDWLECGEPELLQEQ